MASNAVQELRTKANAAYANLSRQLQGMESHLERADAPGEWTARQVLCHLLFEPGWNLVDTLKTFSHANFPVIEIKPGMADTSGPRATMSLRQFLDALDGQRTSVFAYLDTLSEADLQRKSRIPLFKEFMGTDEIPVPVLVGALFDYHWNDHAGQLAKIRKAAGLSEAK
jgi:hypothetical protein